MEKLVDNFSPEVTPSDVGFVCEVLTEFEQGVRVGNPIDWDQRNLSEEQREELSGKIKQNGRGYSFCHKKQRHLDRCPQGDFNNTGGIIEIVRFDSLWQITEIILLNTTIPHQAEVHKIMPQLKKELSERGNLRFKLSCRH